MDHDPLDIRSQESAREDAEDRVKLAQQIEVDDLKWLMSNKRGRRFVFRTLERAGVWRLSFNTNALSMAFNEGTRNEGLRLMAQITTHCADRYTEMLKESKE
ncbi:MAG: endopeptidase [Gammaproteobacteria bacterium]|nr:endopeptidase [Gammaproteobacteria bacterium]MBU1732275.1 endopeptidase [Gammaproteobacteria bacterium]MBU1893845.1 endopeptidase [Gammaproteobacteria bacterium]